MPLATACRQGGGATVYRRYIDAIITELRLRLIELSKPVTTVYIGGGTPSALPGDLLAQLVSRVIEQLKMSGFSSSNLEEVTIEANPEDVTQTNLHRWQSAGVNRISIGVQSFDASQLKAAGREHAVSESEKALEILSREGINFNADLIYGLPGQTIASWRNQLSHLFEYHPNHISAYLLSYEPGTKLYVRRERGVVEETDETMAESMYQILCEEMAQHGYEHYEISNFALPEAYSRHNSSYWNLTPYLGLGCSAHSFDGSSRRFNPSNLLKYLEKIERGVVAAELDEETLEDSINDYIITSLRTKNGLSLPLVKNRWGEGFVNAIRTNGEKFISAGQLILSDSRSLIIPEKYWLTADAILRELLI